MPFTDEAGDPILTTRDAARLLGIAVSTAQLWIENGVLPAWKTPGGHRRIRLSDVNALLRGRMTGSADEAACLAELPSPPSEGARLAALHATRLAGSPPEPVFDRLTWLAAQVTACPIALLTLVTAQRQLCKSHQGLALPELPREDAFCSHTILQDEPMMVPDARLDTRFRANVLVTQAPHVRFYAGVPLTAAGGQRLGALCVMDREPRRLRAREMRALAELAAIAMEEIRRR